MKSVLSILLTLFCATSALAQESSKVVKAQGYLSKDAVAPGDKFRVAIAVEIDGGYHIQPHVPTLDYLIPFVVKFEPVEGLSFSEPVYPPAKMLRFPWSEMELASHDGTIFVTGDVEATDAIGAGAKTIAVTMRVQACNDIQCLGPSNLSVAIPIDTAAAGTLTKDINADIFARADSPDLAVFKGAEPQDDLGALIASQGLGWALLTVFLAGLALNLTPCVYPIIPITISFFMHQSGGAEGSSRLRRTFPLAAMYVLGMAVTYSLLGVTASLSKGLFGAALQSPYVLVGLAGVMVALSLSMFGLYEFKVPDFLSRFATKSTQSLSGAAGALVMGLTMGIVAAPCIGPFVLGLLVHVGAVGNPVYGFFLFFVLALGLGLPYLVLGTFSGGIKSLPRSGMWMVTVRKVFGVVLLGMALYFLMPLMGDQASRVMMVFFAAAALYLIAWESRKAKPAAFAWILRAIGVAAAGVAVWLALPPKTGIEWQSYSESAFMQARTEGRGVVIDVVADWCVPCRELEHLTFTDSAVKQEAENFVRLKLDVTRDEPGTEAAAAKDRFNIRGVPTVMFFDASGNEVSDLRLEGFEKAALFVQRFQKAH